MGTDSSITESLAWPVTWGCCQVCPASEWPRTCCRSRGWSGMSSTSLRSMHCKGGDTFPLTSQSGRELGKALRSSDSSTKPVYVSVGHRISLDAAVRLTHACCRYRVPEPIRQADMLSREYLRKHFPSADLQTQDGGQR
ncbi:hypothetical protein AALO_G00104480 [Alosa alosa]|uniref:Endonuclease V n=1 Tax=Alosa alosa TaxID=278164 RepID=A0AAV6H012_9TELE|nr:hypothetical protein AALO_G00104480 [Alosa alosa]